jgi:hypothetical protein
VYFTYKKKWKEKEDSYLSTSARGDFDVEKT